MRRFWLTSVSCVVLSAVASSAWAIPVPRSLAHDIPMIDTARAVTNPGNVTYLMGGIGEDSREEVDAAKHLYNVHVVNAKRNGDFVSDAHLILRRVGAVDADALVLELTSEPLLFMNLEAGTYELEALRGGEVKKRRFTIGPKTKRQVLHFIWAPLPNAATSAQ